MANVRRHRQLGQSLVIVTLSATALLGMIALGLDAGRLYFQRRDVQNAADAGALAGAQELLTQDGNVGQTPAMQQQANCQAALFAIKNLGDVPQDSQCSAGAYTPNGNGYIVEPAKNIAATVTVWTPSRGNSNEIHVQVQYTVPLTFAAVIGFTSSSVAADAYAHGGFWNNLYAVFGFQAGPGGGNTVQYDQHGNAQIDDGYNGQDACTPNSQGRIVSNSKWHAPNPNRGYLNVNGIFQHLSANDTHAVVTYWQYSVNPVPVQEAAPNYEVSVSGLPIGTYNAGPSINGQPSWRIHAGAWQQSLMIPFASDPNGTNYYIFDNGIYYFNDVDFTVTGGILTNTSDGAVHMANVGPGSFMGGVTNQPPASDGITNGVEFVFDGSGAFSATSPLAKAPSVFFVAPTAGHTLSGTTDSIAFFILVTDTNGSPGTEMIDGTKATAGGFPFQIWGTVFDGEAYSTTTLQAASTSVYAVTGELASPRLLLQGGGLTPDGGWTPSTLQSPPNCNASTQYHANTAGLLEQFNLNYVPRFRGYAYLVK